MTNILDKLQKANNISTIDLDQAFHQVPLDEKSKELTATFQRLTDEVIGPELEPHAFAYVDDVIIVSEIFEDHLKWLKEVLDRLAAAGLSVNPEKCLFFRSEIKYLGFIINNEGVKLDLSKLAPIFSPGLCAPVHATNGRRFHWSWGSTDPDNRRRRARNRLRQPLPISR